jgi:predicted transcriptional regulator
MHRPSSAQPVIHPEKIPASPDGVHPQANFVVGPAEVPWRIREIAMLRGLGYSFREIARPLGVTPQAVSLMLSRHRRSLKSLRGAMDLGSLSPRAVNALARHGIRTREEARCSNVLDRLHNARNCGRKTIEEIKSWIDRDPAEIQNTASVQNE